MLMFGKYSLDSLRGDVFGGLTAGVVALPLALAFGVASGAGAAAGLYGAIALGLFAAVLGGTATQVSGPTGPMTVITAAAVAAFPGDFSAVCLVVALAGALQVAYGAFRLGGFVRFMPYPVVSGFMSGIGIIIILLQLQPILGSPGLGSPLAAVAHLSEALANTNFYSLALAVATMVLVFGTPARITRALPSPLMALVLGTLASNLLGLPVRTIGEIPTGLPSLSLPGLPASGWGTMVGMALALSLLGTIDTLLTSLVADSLTKTRHNSNRELIGQGIGNVVASLFGGLAGAGATMRTVVNIKAGGSTRISGAIHALFLLAVLLGLGPLASRIPLPVLAGILVKVGVDILDYRLLRLARTAPRPDLAVMAVVFGVTVFVDLIVAVAVGVGLSACMITWRIARQTRISIMDAPIPQDEMEAERGIQQASGLAVRVIDVSGPFFFGTTAPMQDKVAHLAGTRVVLVNCLNVPFMDISAAFALGEMIDKLRADGTAVVLAVGEDEIERLASCGFDAHLKRENMFSDHAQALRAAQNLLKSPVHEAPGLRPHGELPAV